jgi:hypothetical protein
MIVKKANYYYFLKWIKLTKKHLKMAKIDKKALKLAKNTKK